MARVNIPEQRRNPVRLYIDEFESMASEAFEGLIAEGRRFKLSLVLSHQNLAQLPAKLRTVVRNNVGLQALFGCGYQDAKEFSGELPEGFTAQDLAGLAPGEVLLLVRGGEAQHFQVELSRSSVAAATLAAYRKGILERIGTPAAEVAARLAERRTQETQVSSLLGPWGMGEG